MMRVVLHAGFHKTGTSSVQAMLGHNRGLLSDGLRILLKPDILTVTRLARHYSRDHNPETLRQMRVRMRQCAQTLDPADPRPVLMSAEDLVGHMPGRHGITQYDAAIDLLPALVDGLRRGIAGPSDIRVFLSTRAERPWLQSNWWQNLRSTRLTLTLDDYCAHHPEAGRFDTLLPRIAARLPVGCLLHMPLEEMSGLPHGPLTPLLDLAGIDDSLRRRIVALAPRNQRPDSRLEARMLELNRSDIADDALADAKIREMRHFKRMKNNENS